ncbi:MAG: NAD-dependent epimerase/dehydratase family protein [Brachymonas sp.]|nr:NAD-dependent epimerase/dehydratase family protein [Brachymonas sp.]
MNILLTGASGFIGRHIAQSLRQAGHHVVAASRTSPMQVDFVCDTTAEHWLPRLQGIDAVVNAVGVLRDSRRQPMQAIHTDAPCALFDACVQAGIRRVVQISALGIADSNTLYAQTKKATEQHLMRLNAQGVLDAAILRPSIVFGKGAAGIELFVTLSRLPVLVLPQPAIEAQVQPLAAHDLADAVARLVAQGPSPGQRRGVIELAGPAPLTLAAFIASLREQAGKRAPRTIGLPAGLSRLSARMGDWIPVSPWCSQTLELLCTPNTADARTLAQSLQRAPVPPEKLLATLQTVDRETAPACDGAKGACLS